MTHPHPVNLFILQPARPTLPYPILVVTISKEKKSLPILCFCPSICPSHLIPIHTVQEIIKIKEKRGRLIRLLVPKQHTDAFAVMHPTNGLYILLALFSRAPSHLQTHLSKHLPHIQDL